MHRQTHPEFVEGCFACKLGTLQWTIVPGAYRATTSMSYYDAEALPDWPTEEEVQDYRSDIASAPVREVVYNHDTKSIEEG